MIYDNRHKGKVRNCGAERSDGEQGKGINYGEKIIAPKRFLVQLQTKTAEPFGTAVFAILIKDRHVYVCLYYITLGFDCQCCFTTAEKKKSASKAVQTSLFLNC